MKAKLDPATLRWVANDLARAARAQRSLTRQGGQSYDHGFRSGAASALEHQVRALRFVARQLSKRPTKARKASK